METDWNSLRDCPAMVEVTFGETNAGLKYHMVQSVVGKAWQASRLESEHFCAGVSDLTKGTCILKARVVLFSFFFHYK